MPAEADIVWENPFTVAPLLYRESAATFTRLLDTPHYKIDTTTPGANKISELSCFTIDEANPLDIKYEANSNTSLTHANFVNHISCFMACYTTKSNLTTTQYVGIEYGTHDQLPPFDNQPANGGVAQLRWVASTDSFELFVGKGDGSAGVAVPLRRVSNIYDTANTPHGVFAELEIDFPGRKINAYINGVLGATYSGSAFPDTAFTHTGPHQQLSGVFVTTGTNAAGATKVFFSGFTHRIRDVKRWNYNIPFNRG